jgi:uncharacterized protein
LLNHGVQPDVQSESGNSALIVAATNGNTDIIQLLLAGGANPNIRNLRGHTALMRTAIANQPKAAVMLLDAGADMLLVDKNHQTARDFAKETGHMEILELLDQRRAR